MKSLFVFLFILIGCAPESPQPLMDFDRQRDIVRWQRSALPLKIVFDENFNEKEVEAISCMIQEWESACQMDLVEEISFAPSPQFHNLPDYFYKDPNFGFYKSNIKVEGIPENALAVCQLRIRKKYSLRERNIYEIIHGDIIINEFNYRFSDGGGYGSFDLASVFLHEIGHFIGLSDGVNHGVMEGHLSSSDVIQNLDPYSQDQAYDLYQNPDWHQGDFLRQGEVKSKDFQEHLIYFYLDSHGDLKELSYSK